MNATWHIQEQNRQTHKTAKNNRFQLMHPVNPPIIRRLISITISMALRHPKTTTKSPSTTTVNHRSPSPIPTASDALPLPLYLTNAIFLTLFFSVAYFLLHRWRFKIRSQTPLHVITGAELAAIGTLIASFIYLLGFFGIGFVQSVIATSRSDDDNDIDNFEDDAVIRNKRKPNPTIMNRLNHVAENDAVVSSKRKPNPSLRIMNALNHLNELNPVAEDVAVVSSKRKPNASLRIMNNLIRLNELNELNHVSEDDVDEDDDDVVTLVHSEHKPNLRIMNNLNELNELNLLNAVLEDEDEKDNLTLEDEAIVRNKYKPNSSLRIMKNNLLKLNQLNPVSKDENEKLTLEDDAVVRNKYKPNSSLRIMKNNLNELSEEDEEVVKLVVSGIIPSYSLETKLGDCRRAASIRREAVERKTGRSMVGLPLEGFDYESILGRCCEMPIGYVQLPVGIAGPLLLNGGEYMVPMATTEGCLVASTNRGCKAVFGSGGATAVLLKDGMTRAPVVRFGTAARAAQLKFFLEDGINFETLNIVFNKSSRFARLQTIQCSIAGRNLYIRFTCSTGDAMGMNMVSKGVQNVLDFLHIDFPDMDVIGISGNFCSDKKPAAVNWIEGRGKSVVCEAVITEEVVRKVLKTTVPALVELNMLKNLAGSAVAGSLGGFNAHASNIVSAIFIATGQDPAQNIESSHCITMMEAVNGGKDLHVSVTMPSIEVGTVGGGTQLASQAACLNLLGVKGGSKESPGSNARLLATIVAGSVLAGELSLMSAISEGQLVKSHMKYNRSNHDMTAIASS